MLVPPGPGTGEVRHLANAPAVAQSCLDGHVRRLAPLGGSHRLITVPDPMEDSDCWP